VPALGRECRAGRARAQSLSSAPAILPPGVSWLTPLRSGLRYKALYS
jgi:hypothetical protein